LSKYDQNLNSFNSKKYIDNVKKVTAIFSKADTFIQGAPTHDSKLLDVDNESQEILINKGSQKLGLNTDNAPKLKKVNIKGDDLDNGVPCKPKENLIYPLYGGVSIVNKKVIPQNSINVCIKSINYYSSKYLAKLLEVTDIKPKQIDTYVIRDTHNNIIIPRMESKRVLFPRPNGPWGSRIPKEMDIDKRYIYSGKGKSQIRLFFTKLFNNRIALRLLTLLNKLGMVCAPLFLMRWIISDNNREFYQYSENKNKNLECQRSSYNISPLKNYIDDYLEKIAKESSSRYVKKGIVRLGDQKGLGLLDNKNSHSHISHLNERRELNTDNNSNMCDNIQVFKIESVKFLQLLNFKSFFTLFSLGKGEHNLLDRFKVQKMIAEGKLWGILNLYLTNNDLYFYILSSLKKQVVKDYNLTKYDIIEPDMLLLYEDKINNITHQAIFNILKNEWDDIKWIISFKFDTVFLNEHRNILILNLKENIDHDYLFLNLIKNLSNMEMIGLVNNKSMSRYNIFEHDKLSEFLLNIFFCKFDNKVNELKYNYYEKYNKLLWLKFWNLKLKDKNSDSHKLARGVITKAKLNFKYIRYLDTFIIGLNGTKSEVNETREILDSFLKSELKLYNLHSYIIDIHNDNFKFMNINISSGLFYGNKYKILFQFPKQLIIKALINSGILSDKRVPICKKNLLKYNLNIIINTYIDVNYFVLNSFAFCDDFFYLKRLLSYYINCSLKLTLQAKLGNKLWSKVIAPITPLKRKSKIYAVNNSWKYIWQRSTLSLEKRLGQLSLNILLLFRLGLISSKILKKLYYFRVNNKKYLKRKYANGKPNCSFNYYTNHINWENNVNFDFLISNYCDSSIPFVNKSREACVAPVCIKILSDNNPRPLA
jgi:hypothetical protein